jgi:hypothetical protein
MKTIYVAPALFALLFSILSFTTIAEATPDMAGCEFTSTGPEIPVNPPPADDWPMMPGGWPLQMSLYGTFAPTEGPIQVDVDGNGDLEIFAGSTNGMLYGWHHTGTAVSGFPVQCGSGRIQSSPAAGDIDGDGDLEILICTSIGLSGTSGEVYAFHANGTLVTGWPQQTFHGMGINSVGLYDFDNDGDCEVFVGADRVYVWQGNGTNWPGFPVNFTSSQYGACSASSCGDIDGDGQMEIIVEGWSALNAFNLDGTVCTGWPYTIPNGGFSYSAPSLVDIDNDGSVEIFCASHGSPSWLFGLRGNGAMLPGFPQNIAGWTYSTPAIGDLDGDSQVEIALLCNSGLVYAFNTDGTPVGGWPVMFGYYNCEAALAMADIDGDGQMEVTFGTNNNPGPYFSYRGNGQLHPDFPFTENGATLPTCSAIADVDGNGTLEIAHHVSTGTVYLWTSPYQAATAAKPWPMPHHDIQHTGNYHFGGAVYNVSIAMGPLNPPIIVPAIGGQFMFNVSVTNHETIPVACQIWTKVTLPNGTLFGPLLGPVGVTLPGGATAARIRVQTVPGNAPAGLYIYRGYVGLYPSNVWDDTSFTFTKVGVDASNAEYEGWLCSGEEMTVISQPSAHTLCTISPNPFNPTTAISFKLQAASFVTLKVYDTAGRLVASLVNGWREAGQHKVTFDGSGLASGVYLYTLTADQKTATGKMILMK